MRILAMAMIVTSLFVTATHHRSYKNHIYIAGAHTSAELPELPDSLNDASGSVMIVRASKVVGTLWMDTTKPCTHCDRARKDLNAYGGFKVIERPATGSAPTFHWRVGDTWHSQVGYSTLNDLIDRYNSTLPRK